MSVKLPRRPKGIIVREGLDTFTQVILYAMLAVVVVMFFAALGVRL